MAQHNIDAAFTRTQREKIMLSQSGDRGRQREDRRRRTQPATFGEKLRTRHVVVRTTPNVIALTVPRAQKLVAVGSHILRTLNFLNFFLFAQLWTSRT